MRIVPSDLSIVTRWPVPHSLPVVEEILENPGPAPEKISGWTESLLKSPSLADTFKLAESLLPPGRPAAPPSHGADSVKKIYNAIHEAYLHLTTSYRDMNVKERNNAMRAHDFPAEPSAPGDSSRMAYFKRKAFRGLEKFKHKELLMGSKILISAIDRELPKLKTLKPFRKSTPHGDIIVSGAEDNVYTPDDLQKACLIIDLGGNNRYDGPVAGAREEQVKVVIDFGQNVTVVSTHPASAGAGVFGIGLFYLPNPSGTKIIETGSYSQGFGLCGTGALFVRGKGVFRGGRYVQGTAAFGVGIFSNLDGAESVYSAELYGQGVGFTRGVGLFKHVGSSSALHGGLVDPDPRESLGATSLCQGVGYGPRAWAAGGIGLCVLKGDNISVEGSYFAQGAGYWHALGAFRIDGSNNSLKARRYSQGSGVHNAAGAFFLNGNENRVVNWGVGPAFGWDRSIGWAFVLGDRNSAQTEWGAASAAMYGSKSIFYVKGATNTLELSGMGGGGTAREIADYALAWIEGDGTRVRSPYFKMHSAANEDIFTSPWGVIHLENVALSSETALPKTVWTGLARGEYPNAQGADIAAEIARADSMPPEKRMELLVAAASAFSVDKLNPRLALARLVSASDQEIPHLVALLDPADFDGYIQIRAALSEMGPAAGPALLAALKTASGEKRAWLLAQLPFLDAKTALPEILKCLDDKDFRFQASGISALTRLLSRDRGAEPGRMTTLENLKIYLSSAIPSKELEHELARGLSTRTYYEAAAIFSLISPRTAQERLKSFELAPQEISGVYEYDKAKAILNDSRGDREKALKNVQDELDRCQKDAETINKKLSDTLKIAAVRNKLLVPSILNAMGNLGTAAFASEITPFIFESSAAVREAASAALGRIGKEAIPYLKQIMQTGTPAQKIQAICSMAKAVDRDQIEILKLGLGDADPQVRKAAIGMVSALRYPFDEEREKIMHSLKNSGELNARYLYGD